MLWIERLSFSTIRVGYSSQNEQKSTKKQQKTTTKITMVTEQVEQRPQKKLRIYCLPLPFLPPCTLLFASVGSWVGIPSQETHKQEDISVAKISS